MSIDGLRVNQSPMPSEDPVENAIFMAEAKSCDYPRKTNLEDDEAFNPEWQSSSNTVKTISDGCYNFDGRGFLCEIEMPEHELVRKWLPPDAVVMEFGARFGTTTCEIAKKLNNSGQIIAVEPDPSVHGFLKQNLQSNNCHARVLHGVVGSAPVYIPENTGYGSRTCGSKGIKVPNYSIQDIKKAMHQTKIDTLLIDCEGCAQFMMDQIGPLIKDEVKLILLEADMPVEHDQNGMDYTKFVNFLKENGFSVVDTFNDCDRTRSGAPVESWCGKWIDHYAFRRN